jgi:hypothetical protein
MTNMNQTSPPEEEHQTVVWLFGCKINRKKRTILRIICNCIILPICIVVDIYTVGVNIDHICVFIIFYLILNLPKIKPHSKDDWMMWF